MARPAERGLRCSHWILVALTVMAGSAARAAADDPPPARQAIPLDPLVRARCLDVLREGVQSDEFWPAIHAAEGLTAAGFGREVRPLLLHRLESEQDDQRRCGLARELVRAGDRSFAAVLLGILAGDDPHGHVHAAESLFKVWEVGDGAALRRAFAPTQQKPLRTMAAAALARAGSPDALAALRQQLTTDDARTASITAWALARVGDESDIPALRERSSAETDPAVRAYFEHALAVLGDPEGLNALSRNLAAPGEAVRTSAAEFAAEVAQPQPLIPGLTALLRDPWLDARIRAAQALLTLALPAGPDPFEEVSRLVFEATAEHPRYTEGSIVDLDDGSLLCAMTEFSGDGSDFAGAQIVGRESGDGGRTWGPVRVLQENTGARNVMSVTLRRLAFPSASGTIALFYLQKNGVDDLRLYVRFSRDEARSFEEPVLVTADPGYHVVNNDRVTQLSSGRLVVPAASTANVTTENHFVSHCYVSDDGGQTWRATAGRVDVGGRGAMEPEVIELSDGRLMMIIRTQLGYIAVSHSADFGESWSPPDRLDVVAPEAPATIRRIPATGHLLLIWNNVYAAGSGHGGPRTPLHAAVSADEGRSWQRVRLLEDDLQRTYAYTSAMFWRNRLLLTYWDNPVGSNRYSARFRSLPVRWLYEE